MIRAGIIGGAGYTAGELIRILLNHPGVQIAFVHSESSAGKYLWEVHQGIFGDTDLKFSDNFDLDAVDVLFLCSRSGRSIPFPLPSKSSTSPRTTGTSTTAMCTACRNGSGRRLREPA